MLAGFLAAVSAQTGPICNSTAALGSACAEQLQRPECAVTASFSWSAKTDWANGPIHENVVFGTDVPSQQAMTIWETEAQAGADPVPVLVFVHGGSWSGKDHTPENMHEVFLPLRAKGFLVVSLGYRLSGTAIYPACVEDVEEGIRWLKANARTYNLDPNRIVVGGTSAGGHIVSLVGTRNGPDSPSRPAAIVNFYGPAWINIPAPPTSGIARLLGCTTPGTPGTACYDLATSASPISHVDASDPPFLHLYGDNDTTSPPKYGTAFHDAFVAAGHADSTFLLSPGAGHFSGSVVHLYPNGQQIFEGWIVDHAKCASTSGAWSDPTGLIMGIVLGVVGTMFVAVHGLLCYRSMKRRADTDSIVRAVPVVVPAV